jgi:SdrD B-like protein/uncharacterized protein DUF4214
MLRTTLRTLLKPFRQPRPAAVKPRPNQPKPRAPRLQAEQLEDRTVPAIVDLTTVGASGSVNGALFQQFGTDVSGTGLIDSFVRIQATGTEQGYNTDIRPVQFDEKTAANFTRSLLLSDVPTVSVDGVLYREFLLDINETSAHSLLSLDELRLFVSASGTIGGTAYDATTGQLAGATGVYDLDAGEDNWVRLNYDLASGSGRSDMVLLVPDAAFGSGSDALYVYLYSQFGTNEASDDGFEEWWVGTTDSLFGRRVDISGQKFHDLNGDGVKDPCEPGLEGWTIFLDMDADGVLDDQEPRTTTDINGNFTFAGLPLGKYRVREVQQCGFTQTTSNSCVITADTETNISDVLIGNFELISIRGSKFLDANGSGTRDSDERGLANWVIYIDVNGNGRRDAGERRTRTDSEGNYSFTNLGPGKYRIREVVQPSWVRMTVNPVDICARSGVDVGGIDFGNMQIGRVGGGGGGAGGGGGVGGVGGGGGGVGAIGGGLSKLQLIAGNFAAFNRQVQFVVDLYRRVLDTAPDLAGLRYYVRLLQVGVSYQRVADLFVRNNS